MSGNNHQQLTNTALTASQETLQDFSDDVEHLWCPKSIPTLPQPPSRMSFVSDYVSKSKPCIIRNAMRNPDGSSLLLSLDELIQTCQEEQLVLTVDVTPDGHGDVIRTVRDGDTLKRMFVKPQEREMTIVEFRDGLRVKRQRCSDSVETDGSGKAIYRLEEGSVGYEDTEDESSSSCHDDCDVDQVLYYSRQNDCLRTELLPLFESGLFPETIPFAQESFGASPDAVNLWIGNEHVVSSMHKDHYENLFYVLSGEKVFTLCPPADAPFLYQDEFDSGTFHRHENGEWVVQQDYNDCSEPCRVQWIEGDVEPILDDATDNNDDSAARDDRHSLLSLTHPIRVHVKAGEMLYLPALWFHRVTQTCETVGINYWYDMQFDSPSWCYFNFIQQLKVVECTSTHTNEYEE